MTSIAIGTAFIYNRMMKNANCEICGRNKNVRNYQGKQLLCGMHREQMRRFGKFRPRTLASRNDFIDKGDYFEMVIYNQNLKEVSRALIDKKDKLLIEKIGSWCMDSGGYVMNGSVKNALHRFLLGKRSGLEIDHINGNKLDNRRNNLRFVRHAVNTQSWVKVYKKKIVEDFKKHLAEGKSIESFFEELK